MLIKRSLFASTAVAALFALQGVAHAQDTRDGKEKSQDAQTQKESSGLNDIIVTATRQATNMQDTPIAITAVTSEDLQDRNIVNVADLASTVPNAQFNKAQGIWGSGVSINIRGLGSSDTGLSGNAPVSFYIDDVYYPLLLGANFDLLDTDHVEVLRGPQGTLFGRNSLAGAVNIVVKQPDPSDAYGHIEVTTGSYNRLDLRASFNVPLGNNAALMVSGMSKKQTGFQRILDFACEMNRQGTPELAGTYPFTNPLTQNAGNMTVNDCTIGHKGGTDVRGGRAAFMVEPTPGLKLTVTGDYLRDLSDYTADSLVALSLETINKDTVAMKALRAQAAYFGIQVDDRFLTDPYSSYSTYEDAVPACTVIPGTSFYNGAVDQYGHCTRGGSKIPRHIDLTNWGVSGKIDWDITNNLNLTGVFAHRSLRESHGYDTDNLPLVSEHTYLHLNEPYNNAEVRLSGHFDFIDFVTGVFYYHSPAEEFATLIQPVLTGQLRILHHTFDTDSKAVFANATLRPFGDKFSFVVGGRYADEVMHISFSNISDQSYINSGSDIVFLQDLKAKKFSWKLGANYQPNDNVLIYASAATGYTLPGYNSRPQQKTQIYQSDPASDIAYELGAKLDLFDRRLRLNIAAFYTDFRNRPTSISGGAEPLLDATGNPIPGNQQLEPLPGGPPGSTRCSSTLVADGTGIVCTGRSYFTNQPAKIRGFEAEFTAEPVDGLTINGSVGWSKFTAPDLEARTVVENRRQNNPFWTANMGVQYRIEAPSLGGSITPRLDWNYQSDQIYSSVSTKPLLPARSLFNARITYDNDKYDFAVALGVTNLFNKFYWVNIFDFNAFGGSLPQTDGQPSEPREWSLTVSKRF
jgi:iron complex outermembrane receptor protein